ncbi:MAG: hypothetical protein H6680_01725 [Desulfobacteraceae bacterium]|nr:hypothetical protein [Desulfobacteraceae bacterium]
MRLLSFDAKGGANISAVIKLAAGRTERSYNNEKNRKGAFWDGSYHAIAVSKQQENLP